MVGFSIFVGSVFISVIEEKPSSPKKPMILCKGEEKTKKLKKSPQDLFTGPIMKPSPIKGRTVNVNTKCF